jgi:hypothetical protein
MDSLEEHIMKHREELDRHKPPRGAWTRIRKELKNDRFYLVKRLSIAAMIAVILGSAALLVKPLTIARKTDPAKNYQLYARLNPQLRETEIYYNNLANTLYKEVTPMLARNPEIEKELFADISHIDSICTEIKKDLKDNVANQDVIEALIRNYRIKIRILEDMLEVLNESEGKPKKSDNHEL